MQLAQHRHDLLLNGLVKRHAVLRRVVEPAHFAEGIIAVVGEAGIPGDLLTEPGELVEALLELPSFLQPPVGNDLPRFLTQRAVGLFEIAAHLNERFLFSPELNGQGAGQLLKLLAQLGLLGFQRQVLLAEQLDLDPRVAVEDLVA